MRTHADRVKAPLPAPRPATRRAVPLSAGAPGAGGACACGGHCPRCAAGADKDEPGPSDAGLAPSDAGPAPADAGAAKCAKTKTVDVYGVQLPGASRTVADDVAKANSVLAQCCVSANVKGTETWKTTLMDAEDPKGALNEYSSMTSPTGEETTMLAHQPGGSDLVHAYYVPKMSKGSRGENFRPTKNPKVPKAVVVADSAASDTFVHELGHILLDQSAHDTDPDNLMASGKIRKVGVDKLTSAQCAKM